MASMEALRFSAMSSSFCANSISKESPKLLSVPLMSLCYSRAVKHNIHHAAFHVDKQRLQHYSCLMNAPLLKSSMVAESARVDSATSSEEGVITELEEEEAAGKIRRLQNGPDVRGIALEGEPGREINLTPAAVYCIAEAFGEWVGSRLGKKAQEGSRVRISLGRDPRITGPSLVAAAAAGLMNAGCCVYDMGLATTPACFMSTILPGFGYDASIMLTASHLPYTRNGMKFMTKDGGLDSVDVESICNVAASKFVKKQSNFMFDCLGTEKVDFMPVYAEHLRNIIKTQVNHPSNYEKPLRGFKIVVNAGNGSGGFFAWDVLEKLGADVSGSLHLEPDGMFPNHIPNPEDKVAMAVSSAAVLKHKAQLGIVFDTDVDRSGVVDQNGKPINGDRLIALMAAIILKEHPGSAIVTDARTSEGLTQFITRRGGQHCLYRVGYRNVIQKGINLNQQGVETHLMMETTGHGAVQENHFLDDGAYSAVKIVIEMVRMTLRGSSGDIGSLIKDLEEPKENIEMRVNILSKPKDAKQRGLETVEAFRKSILDGHIPGWKLDSCGENCWITDGCLVDFDDTSAPGWSQNEIYGAPPEIDAHMYRAKVVDEKSGASGWVHMRQSVHNPNVAINMQSSVVGGCRSMAEALLQRFFQKGRHAHDLDITEVERLASEGIK